MPAPLSTSSCPPTLVLPSSLTPPTSAALQTDDMSHSIDPMVMFRIIRVPSKRDVAGTACGVRRAMRNYFAVYVTCRPTMLTFALYVPLMRPFAAVLPAFWLIEASRSQMYAYAASIDQLSENLYCAPNASHVRSLSGKRRVRCSSRTGV